MLSIAVAFLFLAMAAAVAGFLAGGALGFAAAIVFFAAFLGTLALHKRGKHQHSD